MKKSPVITYFILTVLISIILGACNINNTDKSSDYQPVFSADTSGNKTLIWGFPSFSYCENSELIVKYLNKRLSGAHIIVKACVSYEEYLDNLHNDKFDLTVINGIVAVQKDSKNYSIVGKIKDDSEYCGAILIRKDAGIKKVIDLKGKTIALVTNRTIPGTMMSLYYLTRTFYR
jgi:ABC-type phosphate/phosphonate transport system substrate-binding protein